MSEEEKNTEEEVVFEDSEESPLNPTADEIEERKVDWLCDGRLPLGFAMLIIGDSGVSKSFLIYRLTTHITTGKDWPDGSPCQKGKVLLMNMVENDQNSITKPALRVAGADLKNVTIEGIFKETGEVFDLSKHEARIRSYLDSGEYKAWFLDILLDYTGGKVDFNKAQSIRPVMNRLNKIASEYHIAVVAVLHFGKDFNKPAFLRFAGSHQIRAGVKVIYLVGIDPDDPEPNPAEKRRLFMPEKQNLGGKWKKSWGFHMKENEEEIGYVNWDEDLEHIVDPNYIVSYSDPGGEVLEAIKFILRSLVVAKDYSAYSVDIKRTAKASGFKDCDMNTAIKRLRHYVVIGREPAFHAKSEMRLNLSDPRLYDLLAKYEIDFRKAPEDVKDSIEKKDLKEKIVEARTKAAPKEEARTPEKTPEKKTKTPEDVMKSVEKLRAKHQKASEDTEGGEKK